LKHESFQGKIITVFLDSGYMGIHKLCERVGGIIPGSRGSMCFLAALPLVAFTVHRGVT
jgi:hypothetical protein